jgi:hypothetical protein
LLPESGERREETMGLRGIHVGMRILLCFWQKQSKEEKRKEKKKEKYGGKAIKKKSLPPKKLN